jgi:membrane-bound serine protease (ClpP class)
MIACMGVIHSSRLVRFAVRAGALAWFAGWGIVAGSTPGIARAGQETSPDPTIVFLELDGVVDPFVASYVERGIQAANDQDATAVLLTIDTPGGLDSAMRTTVQSILASRVPVLCYVSPEGAGAASAGTFILISCPVAAMAPGTNVGAAHPVGVSGAIALEKAENDSAAYIRSLAERRGRNAEWAERAVRESVSASAEEALELGVIDHVSASTGILLRDVDGASVDVAAGEQVTIRTTGATLERHRMGWGMSLLHTLLDPNLAFIFFYLGIALVAIEFFVPGGVLGVTGGILLVLAIIALGMLPVDLLGVILLIASVAFFLLELKLPGTGIATGAGLAALIFGGLFLFDPSVPSARVSPWVIGPVALFAALFFIFVVRAAIRMRGKKTVSGTPRLVGQKGMVLTELNPSGIVQVAAEEWSAEAVREPVAKGRRIRVVGVEGLRLKVEAVEEARADVPVASGGEGSPGGSGP